MGLEILGHVSTPPDKQPQPSESAGHPVYCRVTVLISSAWLAPLGNKSEEVSVRKKSAASSRTRTFPERNQETYVVPSGRKEM